MEILDVLPMCVYIVSEIVATVTIRSSYHEQATYPVRSAENQLSANSFKSCSVKAAVDGQPAVLRIDENLSPASLDSVIIAERDTRSEKYSSASPINSVDCLETDQVILLSC